MNTLKHNIPEDVLEKIIDVFKNYNIRKAILYGSRAKGNFMKGSDIDITIVAPELSFEEYLDMLSDIDNLDIIYKIDLTKYELLDNDMKEHIKRVGVILYEA